jgi:gamma-glutamylcyclotransferase (GGCT)/AIG2-like uncharacterized protein YtfP
MKPSPIPDLLFVYGTLSRAAGHHAHRLLADMGELLGHGMVKGRLYQATGFPVLVPDPQGTDVTGEVYRLFAPQAAFLRLDPYEGFEPASPDTSEFCRDLVPVTMSDGRAVTAWAYIYQRQLFDLQPIPHGDYARFLRESTDPA